MAMFNGIKLSGFFRGHEAAQFAEEMAGACSSMRERAHALAGRILRAREAREERAHHTDGVFRTSVTPAAISKMAEGIIEVWRAKAAARRIGLAYWPAMLWLAEYSKPRVATHQWDLCDDMRVDPQAFVVAERTRAAQAGGFYGQRMANDAICTGGWDMKGHYGIAPYDVALCWRMAGCRNNRKFRLLVRRNAPVYWNHERRIAVSAVVSRRMSARQTADVLRGDKWAQGTPWRTCRFSKRALEALGRISPWARWTALAGVDRFNEAPLRIRDLNWAEVARLQGKPAWQRVAHVPNRLAFQMVHGTDLPDGLATEQAPALGWKVSAYRALCARAGLDPFQGPDVEGGLRLPLLNLTRLFGSEGEVARFAVQRGMRMNAHGLHDLGQFLLPPGNTWNATQWRRLAFKHPQVLEFSAKWAAIEEAAGSVPATLREAREWSARVVFRSGIESLSDARVATAAAQAGIGEQEFLDYRNLMRAARKPHEEIPGFEVHGADIGLEGDWVIRRLASDDPIGPMLGLLTSCCQHLHGVASLCAQSGVSHPDTAFAVVEYRGRIVAQSFLWRSTEDHVVFDSIEAKSDAYVEAVAHLVKAAALAIVGRLCVKGVRVGNTTFGMTDDVKRACAVTQVCQHDAIPKRTHYRDGSTQWAIPGVSS